MATTLVHITSSPYTGLAAKEGLDLAMVLATFEQKVDLAFSGAGIAFLLTGQQPNPEQGKALHKMLPSFEFYDLNNLYVQESEISRHNSDISKLATQVNNEEWQNILTRYTHIFRF